MSIFTLFTVPQPTAITLVQIHLSQSQSQQSALKSDRLSQKNHIKDFLEPTF